MMFRLLIEKGALRDAKKLERAVAERILKKLQDYVIAHRRDVYN